MLGYFLAPERMHAGKPVLCPVHVQAALGKVDLIPAQPAKLGNAKLLA